MRKINLAVALDHVLTLTALRKPIVAVEELIWNSLDADASEVNVSLSFNSAGGLSKIKIVDNGTGIPYSAVEQAFGSIGGSPKLKMTETPAGRRLHGKTGKGRLKAFALGKSVKWLSTFKDNGSFRKYSVHGLKSTIRNFEIGDVNNCRASSSGVAVEIGSIEENFPSLCDADSAVEELAQRFAFYLRKYPGITIAYDDRRINPNKLITHEATYQLPLTLSSGQTVDSELTILEWKRPTDRALYLCDTDGFARDERQPGIQAKGFEFTAYLKSAAIEQLDQENAFAYEDIHADVKTIIDTAKEALRTHFRKRERTRTSELVKQWKEDLVYPYEKNAENPLEEAERDVFDIVATKVHEYLPTFESADRRSKQLTFRLLKQALEENPTNLQTILRQVLALPQEQQADLARLLERTTLAALINAATLIVNRLTFLSSLDSLLFGDLQSSVLERRHLHRILINELWIFGEQYTLGTDDQSLTSLLQSQVRLLGRDDFSPADGEVTDANGRRCIIDVGLYRTFASGGENEFEHLIIELKRPSLVAGCDELEQVRRYATAVSRDQRFDRQHSRYKFMLLVNSLNDAARSECQEAQREFGHIRSSNDGRLNIHVIEWSTLLSQVKWRYEFLRRKLEMSISSNDGLTYLREKYKQYLPEDELAATS